MKVLIVVDMQNDFVDGVLGTEEAVSIVPNVVEKINAFEGDELFVTLDTHGDDYLNTAEGKKLPVPHCILGTKGHSLTPQVAEALEGKKCRVIQKRVFATFAISEYLKENCVGSDLEIEMIGVCTDICVISNAMILRACFPDAEITVDASCCAGVTPQKHDAALEVLRSCQIDVI